MENVKFFYDDEEEHWYVFFNDGRYEICHWQEIDLDPLHELEQNNTPFYLDKLYAIDAVEAHLSYLERQIIKSRKQLEQDRLECIGLSTITTQPKA